VKLFAPQPEYPAAARQAGLEGVVLAEARVDGTGRVSDARVLRGSSPELDLAALEALRQWRFEPARRGGEPLAYRYRQEFRFALDPRPPESPPAPAAAARPADVEVTPPVRLATPLPGYTAAAWAAGVEGSVEIRATIDERGEVAGIDVVRGLPHGLTEAAVAAVRRWRFRPATRDGKPVPAEQNLSLRFAL
jgi:TonB family protein